MREGHWIWVIKSNSALGFSVWNIADTIQIITQPHLNIAYKLLRSKEERGQKSRSISALCLLIHVDTMETEGFAKSLLNFNIWVECLNCNLPCNPAIPALAISSYFIDCPVNEIARLPITFGSRYWFHVSHFFYIEYLCNWQCHDLVKVCMFIRLIQIASLSNPYDIWTKCESCVLEYIYTLLGHKWVPKTADVIYDFRIC